MLASMIRVVMDRSRGRTMGRIGLVVALVAAAGTAGVARADDIDSKLDAYENEADQLATDLPHPNQTSGPAGVPPPNNIASKLDAYENEAPQLATDLPHPNQTSGPAGQRRLLDGQL